MENDFSEFHLVCMHWRGVFGSPNYCAVRGIVEEAECGKDLCCDYKPDPGSASIIDYCNCHVKEYVEDLLRRGFTDSDQIVKLLGQRFIKELL